MTEADSDAGLPRTKVHLFYMFQDGRGEVFKRTTDQDGNLDVARLERPFRRVNIFVTAESHVPMVTSFGFGREMPLEYKMKLKRGLTIGGQVIDDTSKPVSHAKIEFDGSIQKETAADNIQFTSDAAILSDSEGRWTCKMVPKELENIALTVKHADFADAAVTPRRPDSPEAQNFIITLRPGYNARGRVQDLSGVPIIGANLRQIVGHAEEGRISTTDASGEFEFKNLNPGELTLTVDAEAYPFFPLLFPVRVSSRTTKGSSLRPVRQQQ